MNHAGPRLTPEILPCNRIGRPGGWLGELRAKGGLSTSLGRRVVLVVVRFSALDVGCLVSTSVAWIVVLLVSSKQVAGTWLPSKY